MTQDDSTTNDVALDAGGEQGKNHDDATGSDRRG